MLDKCPFCGSTFQGAFWPSLKNPKKFGGQYTCGTEQNEIGDHKRTEECCMRSRRGVEQQLQPDLK